MYSINNKIFNFFFFLLDYNCKKYGVYARLSGKNIKNSELYNDFLLIIIIKQVHGHLSRSNTLKTRFETYRFPIIITFAENTIKDI